MYQSSLFGGFCSIVAVVLWEEAEFSMRSLLSHAHLCLFFVWFLHILMSKATLKAWNSYNRGKYFFGKEEEENVLKWKKGLWSPPLWKKVFFSLCLVNLCSQMDCFSMHASVDKEDMSLSFTVVSKREEEENIAFFFAKTYRENINRLLSDLLVFCSDYCKIHFKLYLVQFIEYVLTYSNLLNWVSNVWLEHLHKRKVFFYRISMRKSNIFFSK